MVALQLNQIKISPGQQITLGGINWQAFEAILSELGDKKPSRIAYYSDPKPSKILNSFRMTISRNPRN